MQLRKITPEQSDKEYYTSHGGLTLLGQAIQLAGLEDRLEALGRRRGISHGDIVKSYLGLLSSGKSDFEAAEGARVTMPISTPRLASSGWLRHRAFANAWTSRPWSMRAPSTKPPSCFSSGSGRR
jgi:hypothetical protein